ncbi:MAG: HAD domain-containing protein, partial [Planctomycetota bacterium]|nr:HAD domain-containing protein [Planctomycetota bacterium]
FSTLQSCTPSERLRRSDIPLAEDCVRELNGILKATGAQVILSSGWKESRGMAAIQSMLEAKGFEGRLIDKTPNLVGGSRGEEIEAWLSENNKENAPFVILDDRGDMSGLKDKLVQTSFYHGLTPEHRDRAIAALTRNSPKTSQHRLNL